MIWFRCARENNDNKGKGMAGIMSNTIETEERPPEEREKERIRLMVTNKECPVSS